MSNERDFSTDRELPVDAVMREQAARVEEQIRALRAESSPQTYRARDDRSLIEVAVNSIGDVIEVAVNADLIPHAQPIDLAEAILQATKSAQGLARTRDA